MATGAEIVVRRFYEVLNRGLGNEDAVAGLEPMLHPEVEYVNPADALEPGIRRGVAGFRAALRGMLEGLGPTAQFQVVALVERDDRVLATVTIRTGGGASGVEVAGPTVGAVWTVHDGRVRRLEWSWDPAWARAVFEGTAPG